MESIEQTLNGTAGFGNKVTTTVSRNGDLISNVYFEYNPNALITTTANSAVIGPNLGNTLLKEMELEIGGQRIDKHYSHWLTIWQNLTEVNPTGASGSVGTAGGTEPSSGATLSQLMAYNHQGATLDDGNAATKALNAAPGKAFVPLQFYFCRNPGLALPLIALQYHEVKISLTFASLTNLTANGATDATVSSLSSAKLWVDYIYLDTDERRRFAQQSHEYLIEQLQFQQTTGASAELNFNHPVKELIWCTQPAATPTATAGPSTPVALTTGNNFQIKLNGHDRFAARDRNYFTRAQVHQHHSGYGGVTVADSIAVYSFALRPEEHQPSGSCNFSRIDNARLVQSAGVASLSATNLNVYAVNYNVLRIMSGMGGLAYSN
tara:strand:+ start:27 stop:1163 length:1137 start_codon:yes stop_codon:yes gene_type:complete